MTPRRAVAAFDFDKTLSTRDNFTPFLRSIAGTGAVAAVFARTAPLLVRAALSDGGRDRAKEAVVRRLLGGRSITQLRDDADLFADRVIHGHLRPAALRRAEWHRSNGHELVIVSASLEIYLDPIATKLGFDAALGTELGVGGDGRMTGELAGPNVRREEKVRRLDAWLGPGPVELWAYGDSTGDRELFERADHPVHVKELLTDELATIVGPEEK